MGSQRQRERGEAVNKAAGGRTGASLQNRLDCATIESGLGVQV